MRDLIVIAYGEEAQTAAALATLQRLQQQHLLDSEDAVAVIKRTEGSTNNPGLSSQFPGAGCLILRLTQHFDP